MRKDKKYGTLQLAKKVYKIKQILRIYIPLALIRFISKQVKYNIMKLLLLTFLMILSYGFADKLQTNKHVNKDSSVNNSDTTKVIYSDYGQSTFILTSGDSISGYEFQTVETNYKLVYIALHDYRSLKHYFAKYTTNSKTCIGCEGQERTIRVGLNSFDNPQKTELTIEQDCDDLTLDVRNYKTAKYGCCANEDQLAIYDYNNKLIIEGDSKILLGEIPNSRISFYVAFKNEYRDTTYLGTLYYCYDSSVRYSIKIESKPLPSDSCSPFSPDILIHSNNAIDKFNKENNEYSLWSLNHIKSKDQINNLTLKVAYWCDSELNIDTLKIPIINGKPFGKDDRNQIIKFSQK